MANATDPKTEELKADAAAEKAYAEAAKEVAAKKAVASAPAKAAAAKAAPVAKKVPAKTVKKVAAKKAALKKPAAKKVAAKPAAKAPAKKAAAAPKPVTTSKPTVFNPKEAIMTKTTDFTKTVKEAAADLQTKAKAGFEKAKTYATDVAEFSKGNFDATVESTKILASGVQDMARGEVEAAKSAYETATADMKAFAGIKSPTDLFKLQGEIARRNFDAAVAHYSKNAEATMKLANDAFAPISSRMSLAAEKFSKVA
ncbi:phasin family protein [Tsuneonella mangrovi]|uniref:phasin family protein n=1 Tax=Tsuneonella mangrovi TaxID=1982042 RepID=UPI000BA24E57|nr:phasin family protein [Tsuneonella mangrovi]